MLRDIAASIICSQFESTLGHSRCEGTSDNVAMQVKFSLYSDYEKEDGHRNLTMLLFNGGKRYCGVYAKLDWRVILSKDLPDDDSDPNVEYVAGETPWVLLGFHDSCWRDAVESVLRQYHDKIATIDSLFNGPTGWYREIPLSEETIHELYTIRVSAPGYGGSGERIKLEDLDFKFEDTEESNPVIVT